MPVSQTDVGVLNINKPRGPTSHDVVAGVRRLSGQRRVGHAGTLDPMATGVLVVCLGKATRIIEYIVNGPKSYLATVRFGEGREVGQAFANGLVDLPGAYRHESPG